MITVDKVTKRYGKVQALKEVSLNIASGEILVVVGPSGCGKTSLLRLIAGLEIPDEGSVFIKGVEVSSKSRMVQPHLRGISLIFQDLALWPHMRVREHIEFVLKKERLTRIELRLRMDAIFNDANLVGIENRYPHELSGGEKQRLAIARAIAPRPPYLLMDEPFSSLDPLLKEELQRVALDLKRNLQIGMVYVTHSVSEVFALADRIAVMNRGELEQVGSKESVLKHPENEFVRRFLMAGLFHNVCE